MGPFITFLDYIVVAITSRKRISSKKSSARKRRINNMLSINNKGPSFS